MGRFCKIQWRDATLLIGIFTKLVSYNYVPKFVWRNYKKTHDLLVKFYIMYIFNLHAKVAHACESLYENSDVKNTIIL